ncbi:MAG: hypothetical protein VYA34_10860 [Myxococcota bacterium]|nr:hypothetical protein [Myxococcota bacterium]
MTKTLSLDDNTLTDLRAFAEHQIAQHNIPTTNNWPHSHPNLRKGEKTQNNFRTPTSRKRIPQQWIEK